MNYVSPRLEAAAASTRSEADVRRFRPPFGSIARVKWDERELLRDVLAKVQALELALGTAAEFSSAMPSNYSALLDTLQSAVHDECVTLEHLENRMEDIS